MIEHIISVLSGIGTDYGMYLRGWRLALVFILCFTTAIALICFLPMGNSAQILTLAGLSIFGIALGTLWHHHHKKN